jgi:malonate decarboxylase gamma subunit
VNVDDLLRQLFPAGHTVRRTGDLLAGSGSVDGEAVAVIGTTNHAYIGVELALQLAAEVLTVVCEFPRRPLLLLVDTRGQRLTRRDELLGINGYLAHFAECLELARQRGHRLISLVYDEAVSGGFLAGGMQADAIYALPAAAVQVMNLPAMARVTRIPLERLEELSRSSAIFAPGVENFLRLGGIHEIWPDNLAARLQAALAATAELEDRRRELGRDRGGRQQAAEVARRVREDTDDRR